MAEYKDRIYKEIEQNADYHPSATYDLLTFHNTMFETEGDSLGYDYIPLTGSKLPPNTQVLPFIIGLIPPSANVTGKLLDRSASLVGSVEPVANGTGGTGGTNDSKVTTPAVVQAPEPGKVGILPMTIPEWKGPIKKNAKTSDWAGYWYPISRFGAGHPNGVDFSTEKGVPLVAVQDAKVIRVSDEGGKNTLGGTTVTLEWKGEDGKTYTAYYAHLDTRGVNVGDTVKMGDQIGTNGQTGNARHTDCHCHFDLQADGKSIDPLKFLSPAVVTPDTSGAKVGADASSKSGWTGEGSDDAKKAAEAEEAKAYKDLSKADLNKGKLGQKLQGAQKNVIRALQIAIQQMASTPPLRMVLNPESFKVSSQKVISDGNWGRNGAGIGIEHWGDGQDTISASGRVAGFYALDQGNVGTNALGRSPGLTRMARAFSFSYQNFLSLYLIYRNNGGVWLEDFADAKNAKTTKPNNLALVGSVYIYYDNTIYIGSFDSFEMSEEDTAPFTLSYSFNFTVRASYLLDRQGNDNPNPNTTYGLPAIFGAVAPTAPTNTTSVKPSPVAGQVVQPPPGGAVIDQANKPAPVATQPTGGPSGLYTEDLSNAFSPGGLTLSPPQPIKTTADIIPLGGYGGWTPQLPKK